MKEYNVIPEQGNDRYCLCSVLQAILKRHGKEFSQKEIADQLTEGRIEKEDPAGKQYRVSYGYVPNDEKIKAFLKLNGFDYKFYWYNETPFNEPDSLLNDMHEHDGVIGIKTHAYVLAEFKDPQLKLIDPKNGSIVEKEYYALLREMEKEDGFFGVLKQSQ